MVVVVSVIITVYNFCRIRTVLYELMLYSESLTDETKLEKQGAGKRARAFL